MNHIIEKQNPKIENMIYEVRGKQVMLDSDVANLFGYETKYLNRQVQRNINRFPDNYCFQLNENEYFSLRCQNGTLKNKRGEHRKYLPYVFTEYGITMLAGILKSDIAISASLKIVDTFIAMRKYVSNNLLEQKYYNDMVIRHDSEITRLQESFKRFETKQVSNEIYFAGQIYDAYSKIVEIFKEAVNELIIIDSYADKTILDMIKHLDIQVILITKSKGLLQELDIKKYNAQYDNLKIIYNDTFHDRYFILDKKIAYHCGSSLNYIGKRTFSINKIEDQFVIMSLLKEVNKL